MPKRNWISAICVTVALIAASGSAFGQGAGIENLRQTGKAFAQVARSVSPSVVNIQVESRTAVTTQNMPFGNGWPFSEDFMERFFGDRAPQFRGPRQQQPQERRSIGQGSGFVFAVDDGLLSDRTYILTNNHVVENAESIRVQFQDGRQFEAEVTGRDPQSDIAVIQIDTSEIPALPFGDSSQLEVGEWVVALGNPFGLNHTLTAGIVSATGRTTIGITDYEDFIQTDAAINPGNSGGPLVNLNGEVVGINTAIFSRSGGYMGVGFAIPSNLAENIAHQLIESGEVTRGFLGVVIQNLTPDLAQAFDIKDSSGVLVAQVTEDSPAEAAGIREGDVIVEFDGTQVSNVGSFRNRVALIPPGSERRLTVLRDGRRKELTVELGELDASAIASGPETDSDEIGLTVQTIDQAISDRLNAEPGEGVVVTQVETGSVAARAGIGVGNIILQVDQHPVASAADFRRAVQESADDDKLLLLVRDNNNQRFVALSW